MELVVAAVVALVVTPIAAVVARRTGIVDLPGPLKTHARPTPYLGGVAVFAGLAVGVVSCGRPALFLPLTAALAIGTLDDARPLPANLRLAAEVIVGVLAAAVVPGDAAARVATAGLVIVLLNAVNLLDGQDGLAAGVGLVAALGFAWLGGDARPYGLALAGALAGFLVFNRPPARIYLGDGGAYLVGTALALAPVLTVAGSDGAPDAWSVWLAVPLIVAVPLADTAIAIARRLRAGRRVFKGDRSHVYDQLVDRGWTVRGSSVLCAAAQIVLTAFGVFAAGLDPVATLGCTLVGIVVIAVGAARSGLVGTGAA